MSVNSANMDGKTVVIDDRQFALFCASILSGFTCLANGAIPPRNDTVVKTAEVFEQYLINDGTAPTTSHKSPGKGVNP